MRKPLIVANWKMNGSLSLVDETLSQLTLSHLSCIDVSLCLPFVYLDFAAEKKQGHDGVVSIGAQNISEYSAGAYTGEVSGRMLSELGCSYVLVGHSERRTYFKESNETIAKKVAEAIEHGLTPIICVGETQEERDSGHYLNCVKAQLQAIADLNSAHVFSHAVLAYEPVWAIGTGRVATPAQVQEMHAYIRTYLSQFDQTEACKVRILYGGSVNSANIADILSLEDIDGGLVGGASLSSSEFAKLCQVVNELENK